MRPGLLALEDGTAFSGDAFGAPGTCTGEVCFNTGMTGYQEVLTDPSYHGQIVAMTAPQIGNTGVNDEDDQSSRPWVEGFIVRDLSLTPSSWRATGSLDDYLTRHGITALSEIDTRRLTRHLRDRGAMRGAISSEILNPDDLVDLARSSPIMVGRDLAQEVTTKEPYDWNDATIDLTQSNDVERYRVAAIDFGIKKNILELLLASGCDVTVLPATTPAARILAEGFDAVFLSNGPGDPEPVTYGIATVRELLGQVPIFGICLGHQILALALGATTFKLPFGHRGANHPVKQLTGPHQGRVEITCQNHGFAVDQRSLTRTDAALTHVNLNDRTVEGLALHDVAYSVQYHPEAGPGPHDARYLFDQFHTLIQRFEPREIRMEVNVG